MRFLLVVATSCSALLAASPCASSHKLAAGDNLRDLATFYFGSPDFAPAILLATNTRTRDGFSFLGDPESGTPGKPVCIPDFAEAERWRAHYAAYSRAVAETVTPKPWDTTQQLVTFAGDQELTFATWVRADQVAKYKDTAPQEIWVTAEPNLQKFCQEFSRAHDNDIDELTLRLEQRLGLPPGTGKTTFLRIRLAEPARAGIFRPCPDPSTSVAGCAATPPDEKTNPTHAAWIYRKYYMSFAAPQPSLYPWTALGYTFDWARHGPGSKDLERFGESEFVIPEGAPIQIIGAISTGDYCR